MIGVAGGTVTCEFAIDASTAGLGMLEGLDHEHASAFTHNETIAELVKGARCLFGRIVEIGRHGLHVTETSVTQASDASFRTTGQHDVGVAVTDMAHRFTEGVRTRGTSRDHAEIDGLSLKLNGHYAGGDISNQGRDRKRGNSARATLDEHAGLVLDGLHPADARTDNHAEALGIEFSRIDLGVFDGHPGSGDSILRVAVIPLGLLRVHELTRVKITDFTADLGREVRGVKTGKT